MPISVECALPLAQPFGASEPTSLIPTTYQVLRRYQAQFNGFKPTTGFNTVQDYFNFANTEMRRRMTTYIQGGGLKPLVGEWSFRGAPPQ